MLLSRLRVPRFQGWVGGDPMCTFVSPTAFKSRAECVTVRPGQRFVGSYDPGKVQWIAALRQPLRKLPAGVPS